MIFDGICLGSRNEWLWCIYGNSWKYHYKFPHKDIFMMLIDKVENMKTMLTMPNIPLLVLKLNSGRYRLNIGTK